MVPLKEVRERGRRGTGRHAKRRLLAILPTAPLPHSTSFPLHFALGTGRGGRGGRARLRHVADRGAIYGPRRRRIALIQGSIDVDFDLDDAKRDNFFAQYWQLTQQAVHDYPHLDALVWPETMFPYPLVKRGARRPAAGLLGLHAGEISELARRFEPVRGPVWPTLAHRDGQGDRHADDYRCGRPTFHGHGKPGLQFGRARSNPRARDRRSYDEVHAGDVRQLHFSLYTVFLNGLSLRLPLKSQPGVRANHRSVHAGRLCLSPSICSRRFCRT